MRKSGMEPADPITNIQPKNISETKRQQKMALSWNIANFYCWFYSPHYWLEENFCSRIS